MICRWPVTWDPFLHRVSASGRAHRLGVSAEFPIRVTWATEIPAARQKNTSKHPTKSCLSCQRALLKARNPSQRPRRCQSLSLSTSSPGVHPLREPSAPCDTTTDFPEPGPLLPAAASPQPPPPDPHRKTNPPTRASWASQTSSARRHIPRAGSCKPAMVGSSVAITR